MIIDFLPIHNANYHEKQINYVKAASAKAHHIILLNESSEESATFYFKENLRDDTWDDNHQD
jgi:hypothetical protein